MPQIDYTRFLSLTIKHLDGSMTEEEHKELDNDWLYTNTNTNRQIFSILINSNYADALMTIAKELQSPTP